MREIKFRGRRIDNGEWVYGDICHHDGKVSYIGQHPADGSMVVHDLTPETVGQYTGFRDKRDREIYEGDFMKKENGNISPVVHSQGCFQTQRYGGLAPLRYLELINSHTVKGEIVGCLPMGVEYWMDAGIS